MDSSSWRKVNSHNLVVPDPYYCKLITDQIKLRTPYYWVGRFPIKEGVSRHDYRIDIPIIGEKIQWKNNNLFFVSAPDIICISNILRDNFNYDSGLYAGMKLKWSDVSGNRANKLAKELIQRLNIQIG